MHGREFAKVGLFVSAMLLMVVRVPAQTGNVPLSDAQPAVDKQTTKEVGLSSNEIVEGDLIAEKFDELDRMADKYRHDKSRMTGGGWKLQHFYTTLDSPQLTDKDSQEHIAHLEHWIQQRPESITARVALAGNLKRWAWEARGNGQAETVTDEGWKLFEARIERDQQVLEGAAKMQPMCPQWYSEMMTVGLAEGWDRAKMQDLFDRATQFEPGYLSFYREFASYLLPKWEGHPGDAAAFAKTAADRVGGDEGDVIYFEFATVVIKRGNGGIPTEQMDWERIKRGAFALEKEYGQSQTTMNQFAFMSWRYRDAAVAGPLFAEIGERWAPGVWTEKGNYTRAREWAQRGKVVLGAQGTNAGTPIPPQ